MFEKIFFLFVKTGELEFKKNQNILSSEKSFQNIDYNL